MTVDDAAAAAILGFVAVSGVVLAAFGVWVWRNGR